MNIDNAYYTLGKLRFRLEDRCELNEMCTVFFYPVFSYEFHIYHKMLLFVGDNNFTKFISLCNTIITANIWQFQCDLLPLQAFDYIDLM